MDHTYESIDMVVYAWLRFSVCVAAVQLSLGMPHHGGGTVACMQCVMWENGYEKMYRGSNVPHKSVGQSSGSNQGECWLLAVLDCGLDCMQVLNSRCA